MATVCLYFQMHQPPRLRRYRVFDSGTDYFNGGLNAAILRDVAGRCYRPATRRLLALARRHAGRFRCTLGITGVLIEQLAEHAPDVLDTLAELAGTGCVEFLGETYEHSLAYLYSPAEFREQVRRHAEAIRRWFAQTPRVFRNTELIYDNALPRRLAEWGGYEGLLTEGAAPLLAGRGPGRVYRPLAGDALKLMVRDRALSDDLGFRFADRARPGGPMTPEGFAAAADAAAERGEELCNVFLDLEAFGEHQRAETGIFEFLERMPGVVLGRGHAFRTVGEAMAAHRPGDRLDAPRAVSWADAERDLTAWLGDAMQTDASGALYDLEGPVKDAGDPKLLADWRRLTVSDHFHYMSLKGHERGAAHARYSPYESPYDAYLYFMNVVDHIRSRSGRA